MNSEFDLINYLTNQREKGILIWLFNIGTEKFWSPNNTNVTVKNREEDELVNKIEEISLLMTRKQDYFLVRKVPDHTFLNTLSSYGFEIPNFLYPKHYDLRNSISELVLSDQELLKKLKSLGKEKEVYFLPYGISDMEEKIATICDLNMAGASAKLIKELNDKVNSRHIAKSLGFKIPEGTVCSSLDDMEKAYYKLRKVSRQLVIKNSVGASGKGIYRIQDDRDFETTMLILKRLTRKENSFQWIIEKWYEKKYDTNYQIYVNPDGKVTVFSIKEQIMDDTIYVGSIMPPRISGDLQKKYIRFGEKLGRHLYQNGFTGILGVDSIVDIQNEIIPIIEINARFTLSTYLSFLCKKYPNKLIYTVYEKVRIDQKMNYEGLMNYLVNTKIAFNRKANCGVIVYSAAALKSLEQERGRMFLILVADSVKDFNDYKNKIKEFFKYANQKVKALDLIKV